MSRARHREMSLSPIRRVSYEYEVEFVPQTEPDRLNLRGALGWRIAWLDERRRNVPDPASGQAPLVQGWLVIWERATSA